MESVWSVSKLSTEPVGSRRELVANCVHTVASAVCIGHYCIKHHSQHLNTQTPEGISLNNSQLAGSQYSVVFMHVSVP